MTQISKIDKNFICEKLNVGEINFSDIKKKPFDLYGVFYDEKLGRYLRMPDNVAEKVSEGVRYLNTNTSGGRVRFTTDSEFVAIKCVTDSVCLMSHMTLIGSCGFALYADGKFYNSFFPESKEYIEKSNGYEAIVRFADKRKRDITIYFPLYNPVQELFVGLQPSAVLGGGKKYGEKLPIVFYGSSITQGGCASRPGNSYDAIVARMLNSDYINFGFSGNAKGEPVMADYLATLDTGIFVYDYDHNAPGVEHLKKTHYAFYERYRKLKPNTPIVMLSKCDFENEVDNAARRDIIRNSYKKAIKSGDKNIYFIDGETLFGKENRDCCTVDGGHPTDAGFLRMAEKVFPLLYEINESSLCPTARRS
jgi:lysophospholipase L1-like esterase